MRCLGALPDSCVGQGTLHETPTAHQLPHPLGLAEDGRNVAPNIALEIEKSRSHVNIRLPVLADYGLVRKVEPADNSGLYEITDKGESVLALRGQYDSSDDFEDLVERYRSGELDEDVVTLYNSNGEFDT